MPNVTEQPPKSPRTWRPMALWIAGILLALGLAWFIGAVVVPVWQVRSVLKRGPIGHICDKPIGALGGPDRAARKLDLYLRMPHWLASERKTAVAILGHCGSGRVPALSRVLRDQREAVHVRETAARGLAETADLGQAELRAALRSPDSTVRLLATGTLYFFAPVPEIEAMLDDPDPAVRRRALGVFYACFSCRGDSRLALSAMCRAVRHPLPDVRRRSAAELGALWIVICQRDGQQEAGAALAGGIDDPDLAVRVSVARSLSKYGPQPEKQRAIFRAGLACDDPLARAESASGLCGGKVWTDEMAPLLITALGDRNPLVQICAAQTLGSHGGQRAVGPLMALLAATEQRIDSKETAGFRFDVEASTRLAAIRALGFLGSVAAEAVPAIEPLLNDSAPALRAAAAEALKKIRGEKPKP